MIFYTKDEIISNKSLKESLYKNFYIKEEDIDKISIKVKNKTKINNKGLWLIDNDKDNIANIKTINGFYIENGKQTDIKLKRTNIKWHWKTNDWYTSSLFNIIKI